MKTLLLADDDTDFRQMFATILKKRLNIEVLEAKDGLEAIEVYQKYKPDCVFLDVKMPIMDGETAYKKIKEIDPKAKIYFMSGFDDISFKDKVNSLGAQGYLAKPIVLDEVIKILQSI
ncbi:MAG: response regulator [Candidatus Aenigmatarchaeota archaeon]